jgi:hypothetical protein
MTDKTGHSPHLFTTDDDGSVRSRIRLSGNDASLIEEAAGATPLLTWIHRTLHDAARQQRQSRTMPGPLAAGLTTGRDLD